MPIGETTAGIWTAVAAAFAAVAGAWGTQRAKRADVAAQMLTEARAWVDDFREAERLCREELGHMRSEMATMSDQLGKASAEVACLRREIDRLRRLIDGE